MNEILDEKIKTIRAGRFFGAKYDFDTSVEDELAKMYDSRESATDFLNTVVAMLEKAEKVLHSAERFYQTHGTDGAKLNRAKEKEIVSKLHFLFSNQKYIDLLEVGIIDSTKRTKQEVDKMNKVAEKRDSEEIIDPYTGEPISGKELKAL